MIIVGFVNLSVLLIVLVLVFIMIKRSDRQQKCITFIDGYTIPSSILEIFHQHYPNLTKEQMQKAITGFKIFVKCHLAMNTLHILAPPTPAMPSKLVEKLWHEFTLDSFEYHQFCSKVVGHIVHYRPTEEIKKGMDVIWQYSCGIEGINDCNPKKLPLLFAIDQETAIEDGLTYDLISCGEKWGGAAI